MIWHAGKSTRLAFPGSPKKLRVEPSNFTSPQWKPREAERCFLVFFSLQEEWDRGACVLSSADGNE